MNNHQFQKLVYSNDFIAYKKLINNANKLPTIVFCHGFKSDMNGNKALFLHDFCEKQGYNYVRFDYLGHGLSSGKFTDGTISKWLNNVLLIIDSIKTPVILVGSSMGGWLALLSALARPKLVTGIISIAIATDFTEELIWQKMNPQTKQILDSKGIVDLAQEMKSDYYPITKELIEDGRKNLLLNDSINIDIPIILLHGMEDKDVPYTYSIRTAQKLVSKQVTVVLTKSSDHRMSSDDDLKLLTESIQKMYSYITI
jgi:pimeloyl-ACP methyl ester carboxylesterase